MAKHLPPRSTVSSYFLRWEVSIEIAKRSDIGQFVALPNGWIVERTIAWLNRWHRLAKDWERLNLPTLGHRSG